VCNAEKVVTLKVGCQVMLLRNLQQVCAVLYVCMYMCMYMYMYVYVYVCVCVCMCMCLYVYVQEGLVNGSRGVVTTFVGAPLPLTVGGGGSNGQAVIPKERLQKWNK
jgi:hypothetical protein